MHGDIYLQDIKNRYTSGAGYTVTESTRGALTLISVVNGTIDGRSEQLSRDNAIWNVRLNLIGGADILASLTTTQINALTNMSTGQLIFNSSIGATVVYNGSNWV